MDHKEIARLKKQLEVFANPSDLRAAFNHRYHGEREKNEHYEKRCNSYWELLQIIRNRISSLRMYYPRLIRSPKNKYRFKAIERLKITNKLACRSRLYKDMNGEIRLVTLGKNDKVVHDVTLDDNWRFIDIPDGLIVEIKKTLSTTAFGCVLQVLVLSVDGKKIRTKKVTCCKTGKNTLVKTIAEGNEINQLFYCDKLQVAMKLV